MTVKRIFVEYPQLLARARVERHASESATIAARDLQFRNFYQDFIGWAHPIHRNRITMFRRTTDAQRPIFAPGYVDFPPSDNFAANEAITFFIQGVPHSESIESLQDVEFVFIR